MRSGAYLRELSAPAGFFAGAIFLKSHVVESPEMANQMTRGLVGPASWPQLLLLVIAFFSVLWAIERVVLFKKQNRSARAIIQKLIVVESNQQLIIQVREEMLTEL